MHLGVASKQAGLGRQVGVGVEIDVGVGHHPLTGSGIAHFGVASKHAGLFMQVGVGVELGQMSLGGGHVGQGCPLIHAIAGQAIGL
jgi:hypothetical protein